MNRLVLVLVAVCALTACSGGGGGEQTARVSVQAELPVADAWALLSDFSLAHNYVPGLSRTDIVSHKRHGTGAHRRVYDADGDFIEETITAWEEGAGFTIRLHQGDAPMAPFKAVFFDYRIDAAGAGRTDIALALRFEMPLGGFGHWIGQAFMMPAMESELTLVAAGMKAYYETGEPASDADRERLAPQVAVTSGANGEP